MRSAEVIFIGMEQGPFLRRERPWWKFHPQEETTLGIAVWDVNKSTARAIYTAGADKSLGIPKENGMSGGPETVSVYPEELTELLRPFI